MKYFDYRKQKKEKLEKDRKAYESILWHEWHDAKLNIIGIAEGVLIFLAFSKSKLSLVTPVEGKIIYSFLFEGLCGLCNFIDIQIDKLRIFLFKQLKETKTEIDETVTVTLNGVVNLKRDRNIEYTDKETVGDDEIQDAKNQRGI